MMAAIRYTRARAVPQSVSPGRVLAHNSIRHTVDMPCGVNGFRSWTWRKEDRPPNFVNCGCGYAGLPHVAERDHAENYKCEKAIKEV
jgi:hypothetical protein